MWDKAAVSQSVVLTLGLLLLEFLVQKILGNILQFSNTVMKFWDIPLVRSRGNVGTGIDLAENHRVPTMVIMVDENTHFIIISCISTKSGIIAIMRYQERMTRANKLVLTALQSDIEITSQCFINWSQWYRFCGNAWHVFEIKHVSFFIHVDHIWQTLTCQTWVFGHVLTQGWPEGSISVQGIWDFSGRPDLYKVL